MRYRESYAKKLARAELWTWAEQLIPDEGKILVLASETGGDVGVLKSLGISPLRIVAVDRSRRAIKECEKKHGAGPTYVHADLDHWVKWTFGVGHAPEVDSLGSAFLDFCSTLGGTTLGTIVRVARRLHDNWFLAVQGEHHSRNLDSLTARLVAMGEIPAPVAVSAWKKPPVLAVAFLRGRESFRSRPGGVGVVREIRGDRTLFARENEPRHVWRSMLQELLESGGSPLRLFRYMAGSYPEADPTVLRLTILTEALRLTCDGGWIPRFGIDYSGTSPMSVLVFTHGGQEGYHRVGQFTVYRSRRLHDSVTVANFARTYASNRPSYEEYERCRPLCETVECRDDAPSGGHDSIHVPFARFSEKYAKDLIRCECESGVSIPELYQVSRGTVSAWKASSTRKKALKSV